ncbi:hypothetical protein CFOL_v3_23082, partial [Cephalotus follicularis]
EVLVY